MTNYIYDINYGHYIPLNEGEAAAQPQESNQETQNTDNANADEQQQTLVNLESNDVLKIRQERADKIKAIEDRIIQKNNNILQIQTKLNQALAGGQPTNPIQKELLQAKKDLSQIKFEKAKTEHDLDDKILQAQLSLVENVIADEYPTRYKGLNEEQLSQGKIYLNTLIESDHMQIIKEMSDFKKIMGRANLLYGKDQNGYFAICMDNYDLNRLSTVLERAGYMKDAIMGCCYSQLYL